MTYDKQELINSVKSEIESVISFHSSSMGEREEDDSIDIRLQLVDDTYCFHSGDSQCDTDHRGCWGHETLIFDDSGDYSESDVEEIAEALVTEALELWDVATNVVKEFHKSKFSYQYYKYGALELFNDGESICFMQGDEAEELHNELENCSEQEQSALIEPYA